MKWKKMTALFLCGAMTAGLFAGCAKGEEKKGENKDKKEIRGGYVEEELKGPWGEEELYLGSFLNKEKQLSVYTQKEQEGEGIKVYSYTQQGKDDWKKQEETWVEERIDADTYVNYLLQGEDRNLYLMTNDVVEMDESGMTTSEDGEVLLPPQPTYLYRHTSEGETQEVPVESLDLEYQEQHGGFMPYYLGVAENGTIALVEAISSNIVLYDGATGKETYTLPSHQILTNSDGMICLSGNTVTTLGQDQKSLVSYDVTTGEETSHTKVEGAESGFGFLDVTEDGTYYIASDKGISVYKENGSIGEQIYDGSRGSMGETAGSLTIKNFLAAGEQEFYGVYESYPANTFSVCRYYYDKHMSTKTEKTLSVYGLYESGMAEAAVRAFEKKHPEVDVDYQYAMKREEEGNPEDYIDALNTSLLNQEGADVLFLDDLPVDSYIEKGILEDLTAFADQKVKEQTLVSGVAEGMKKDGKLYELPATFRLPVFYGTEEAIARLDSLESVKQFLEAHPGEKIVGAAAYEQIAYLLFAVNYEQLKKEDGTFSQEKIAELLELSRQLIDESQSEDMEMQWGTYFKNRIVAGNTMSPFSGIGMMELYEDTSFTGVDDLYGLAQISLICDVLETQPGLSIRNPHQLYLPGNRMGINASSKEKELAEEFMEIMLSDEIQQQDFVEGLPVRTESLEKLADIAERGAGEEMFSIGFTGGEMHSYGYPTREQITPVLEMAKEVKTPLVIELSVRKTFLECAEQYFGGTISAEEAAKTLGEKMDIYLSE